MRYVSSFPRRCRKRQQISSWLLAGRRSLEQFLPTAASFVSVYSLSPLVSALEPVYKKVAEIQFDEVYFGTAEERADGDKPNNSIHPGREFIMCNNVLNDADNWEGAIQNLSSKKMSVT
jgi:hypothetical protein